MGEERIAGSPHTAETKASGTFDFHVDLGDLFAIVDYVEKSGGTTPPSRRFRRAFPGGVPREHAPRHCAASTYGA